MLQCITNQHIHAHCTYRHTRQLPAGRAAGDNQGAARLYLQLLARTCARAHGWGTGAHADACSVSTGARLAQILRSLLAACPLIRLLLLQHTATCCDALLQRTTIHCSALQCTASALQHTYSSLSLGCLSAHQVSLAAKHCNTLQNTAMHCNPLQYTATHTSERKNPRAQEHQQHWLNSLQHITTHCNTLQHTETHCNTLRHTAAATHRRAQEH